MIKTFFCNDLSGSMLLFINKALILLVEKRVSTLTTSEGKIVEFRESLTINSEALSNVMYTF